jgi:hypothetical protein
MFALPGSNGSRGEWLDGRVYSRGARREDKGRSWPASAFLSVRVLWYAQDADTLQWFVEPLQTDNELSPWDLTTERNPFVRADMVHALCLPTPALTSPAEVVE